MPAWPSSLRSRLTLWYTTLLALPLIAFAVISYAVFASALLRRTDHFIGDALTAFARELAAERRTAVSADEAIKTTVEEVRFQALDVMILDSAGRLVAATEERDAADARSGDRERPMLDSLRARSRHEASEFTARTAVGDYRVAARPLALRGANFLLAGSYALSDIEDVLSRIRKLFGIAIPLLILFAATGGFFLAKRSLAPVGAMADRAQVISATNLHQRLPVSGGAELVRLSQVVNALLNRLESSFEQQRRFMADASHELRTPTTILRTEADVTLSRPHRTEDEYRSSILVMQQAARRLARIVDDLFLLARADSGHLVPRKESVYLEEIVHDAARGVRPVAEQRGVSVALGDVIEAPFEGDADLLGRLLLNLLDNAIKHSSDGGAVNVNMRRDNGRFAISVVDNGAGIPPEAQAQVFERFFRVDVARSRHDTGVTSGAGLGLAIARRIAELHGGALELVDSRPGHTEFRVSLPA